MARKTKKDPVTKVRVEQPEVLNAPPTSDRKAYTKFMVDQQGKVTIMIPSEPGEEKGATHTFQINGASWTYPKNEMIEVPRSIAELYQKRWAIQTSPSDMRYANQAKTDALSS